MTARSKLDRLRGGAWDMALWALLAALLPTMAALSFDFGITWDEHFHVTYGNMVYNYFASGFRDTAALDYLSLYLYGGLFDLICTLGRKLLPFLQEYDARHLLNSVFGWTVILYAALLARRVFGAPAGLAAALFLVLSPAFFGHCMNNPKDIPFAAFFLMALYFLSRLKNVYPYATARNAAAIIAATALALNIRVGGLILIFYAGLYVLALALGDAGCRRPGRWCKLAAGFGLCAALAMVLGTLFWPWALQNPLVRPVQALAQLSRFPLDFQEIYAGEIIHTTNLPWDYIFRWFAITTPLGVLVLTLAAPLFYLRRQPGANAALCLAFAALFPVGYVVARHAVLYNGFRHLLFVYPLFAILAAGSFAALLREGTGRRTRVAVALLVVGLGFYHPARFHLVNHPNQAVYFNQFVGGVRGAFLRYDLDYWGNSYKQAVDRLEKIARMNNQTIVFNAGLGGHVAGYYSLRFPNLRYIRGENAPYTLELVLGGAELVETLDKGFKIDAIEADGAPLCLIKMRLGQAFP